MGPSELVREREVLESLLRVFPSQPLYPCDLGVAPSLTCSILDGYVSVPVFFIKSSWRLESRVFGSLVILKSDLSGCGGGGGGEVQLFPPTLGYAAGYCIFVLKKLLLLL